jgi:small-conductance mechanosensitive channel
MQFPYSEFVIVFAILIAGLIFGLILTKIVRGILKRIGVKRKWKYSLIIVDQLKGLITISSVLVSLYISEEYYIHNPKVVYTLDKLSLIIIVLAIGLFLTRVIISLIKAYYEKHSSMLQSTSLINNIIRISVLIIALMIIFQSLGIPITPLLTALGVGGIAVSLALQDTLSNLFAGVNILTSGKIKVGDTIKLDGGNEGIVDDISWRYTSIKLAPDNIAIIPNSKLASSFVTNFSLPTDEQTIVIELSVALDSDLEEVEKVILEVADSVMKEIVPEVENYTPLCRFSSIFESGINVKAILKTSDFSKQFIVKHEFIKRIVVRFRKENIIIPYPVRTVNINSK